MIDEEVVNKYLKAGRIASRVRRYAIEKVRPGTRIFDLCEMIERKIVDEGGKPAFPCNISINNVAAHYTSYLNDKSIIPEESVVKVDIGVHVNGYIADTAVTVSFNPKYDEMLTAVETALNSALEHIKPGVKVSKIGEIVEKAIKSYGYRPIKNLSGHSIERYNLHSGVSIPNVKELFSITKFQVNHAYAVEPFGTDGVGYVVEGKEAYIYSLLREKKVKNENERKIIETVKKRYMGLPFTERWLRDLIPNTVELRKIIRKLVKEKIFFKYPVLMEASGGVVAQFEHTILLLEKETLIITL